jgi:hypothetical protein
LLAPFHSPLNSPARKTAGLFFDFDLQVCYNSHMKTYTHVEDYLEVVAGKRDIVTGNIKNPGWLGYDFAPIVNLARYDTSFLDSVTDQTIQGNGMTDRQAELAVKLLLKYTRQLNSKGVSVEPLSSPRYRKSLRIVDRSKRLWMDTETMYAKFPYDQTMISQLRELLANRQGKAKFDKTNKVWAIAISEFNVNFLVTWAQGHGFDIDAELLLVMQEIMQIEASPYRIELVINNDNLSITNAPDSMLEYIEKQNISMSMNNIVQLADLSSVLGYTIHPDVQQVLDTTVGTDISVFLSPRWYELHGDAINLSRAIRYAQQANRLPVVVYDPAPENSLPMYQNLMGAENVTVLKNRQVTDLSEIKTPVLFTHRAMHLIRMPLLISHAGLLVGAEKQMMIQNSEKIIYFNQKL